MVLIVVELDNIIYPYLSVLGIYCRLNPVSFNFFQYAQNAMTELFDSAPYT